MSHGPTDLKLLFEEFNRRIDKPIEFNHLLCSAIQDLYNLIAAQQIQWHDGVPYILDVSRGKTLSTTRAIFTGGYYGLNQDSRYLRVDGVTTAVDQGLLITRDATITAMWAKSRSIGSWTHEVRRNGVPITLASVPVISSIGNDTTMSVDLDAGDILQFYMSGVGVDHPIVGVEIAWRYGP